MQSHEESKAPESAAVCRPLSWKLPRNLLLSVVRESVQFQAGVSRAQVSAPVVPVVAAPAAARVSLLAAAAPVVARCAACSACSGAVCGGPGASVACTGAPVSSSSSSSGAAAAAAPSESLYNAVWQLSCDPARLDGDFAEAAGVYSLPCVRVTLDGVSSAADAAALRQQLLQLQASRDEVRALEVQTSAIYRPWQCSASGARVCRLLLDEIRWRGLQCLEVCNEAGWFPAVSAPVLQELSVAGDLNDQDVSRLHVVLRESVRLRQLSLNAPTCVQALPERNESLGTLLLRGDSVDSRFSSWLAASAFPLRVRGFESLLQLDVRNVDRLTCVLGSDLPACLQRLTLDCCNELSDLDVRGCNALQVLSVSQCARLTHVSNLSLLGEQLRALTMFFSPLRLQATDVQGLKLRTFNVNSVAFMSEAALRTLRVSQLEKVQIPFGRDSLAARAFVQRLRENGRLFAAENAQFSSGRLRPHALGGARLVDSELEPGTEQDDALLNSLSQLEAHAAASDDELQQQEDDVVDLTRDDDDDEQQREEQREQDDGSARGRRVRRRVSDDDSADDSDDFSASSSSSSEEEDYEVVVR